MKRILIPTDFSDNAWNTILYAIELYRNVPCEFHLLNTYDLEPVQLINVVSSQRIGHLYEAVKIESEQGLKMTIEDIHNSKPGVDHTFKMISKKGALVDNINKLSKNNPFNMIIIGTKGATGSKNIFLGSNTQKVVKNISYCPILVIPDDSYFKEISAIAFATDFERMYHKAEVTPILEFAKNYNATIRMIHIYDEPGLGPLQHYNSSTLEHYFKRVKYDFHVMSDFSTVENAIQEFIEELEIDILVMINYEHSFIERIIKEPIIKKMTFHTTIPFLVIPADTAI
ncbi:nucleotide-binding universal stress UspA family protein [Aquimarina sp. MAR_2010_214]|uniref:universal stress protein n=1 Tax=Aquimarina sp. MAR_2010_214 TaxID=1250026 RepID=UPI000C70BA8D|nr:universal stress protein [Aquimarina sp. MAR_2010_214]PKV48284.1 nucleotide-binding universal stress UspA family protein [Aquimarina sp. MAR_2010_214]